MNINKEKEYIYKMMQNIIEERRFLAEERLRLSESYFSLKERLEKLEDLELRGLDNLSIKGYVDLRNDHENKTSLDNLEREMVYLREKIEGIKKNENNNEETVISPFEVSEQRWKDSKNKPVPIEKKQPKKRAKRNRDSKLIYDTILDEVKKRKETPSNALDIYNIMLKYDWFKDYDVSIKEFRSNMFYRTMSNNSDVIEKVDAGTYRYLLPQSEELSS